MANFGPPCWNHRCVLRYCDGVHHADQSLRTWMQGKDWVFNSDTRNYEPPAHETDVDPRNTSPRL